MYYTAILYKYNIVIFCVDVPAQGIQWTLSFAFSVCMYVEPGREADVMAMYTV